MKIITLLTLLSFYVFASTLDSAYEKLNTEISSLSPQLNAEKEMKLYYLTLLTYKKILNHEPLDLIEVKMINMIDAYHLQTLKEPYLQMIAMKTSVQENSQQSTASYIFIVLGLVSLLFGFLIGYLINKRKKFSPLELKLEINKELNKDFKLRIEELENEKNHLLYKIESTNKLKKSFFQERKSTIDKYIYLINNLEALNQDISKLKEIQEQLHTELFEELTSMTQR